MIPKQLNGNKFIFTVHSKHDYVTELVESNHFIVNITISFHVV